MTLAEWEARFQTVTKAVDSGSIETASRAQLIEYNAWLCHANAPMHFNRNYTQVCETVRLHMLRTMMEAFEERTKKTERWVMALAIASLVASVIQIFS